MYLHFNYISLRLLTIKTFEKTKDMHFDRNTQAANVHPHVSRRC